MKRHIFNASLLTLLLLLLAGCKAENEYSKWACSFAYSNMIHNDATLASAMIAESRGVFCKISESGVYIVFQNNQNLTSQQPMSEEERRNNYIFGLNNGIIVGYQTFNTMPNGGFVAYDGQCPNCVRRENNYLNPKFHLSMSSNGIATCPKCKKTYDMNNGGIIQNGEEGDVGLEKYLASTTGPFGFISVGTKR